MNTIKKLLILSSGGDAPGMNAAIRAVLRIALHYDIKVYGSMMGYSGLVNQDVHPLTAESVANCIQRGGTILKTCRCPEFQQSEVRTKAIKFLNQKKFDALVVLGGNGSFAGAAKLAEESDIQVIGIPCTIDNDIVDTDYCIGFDTARNTALDAIDKIRDTASSLNRNFIIEVMGRDTGFLAVDVGIAGGAEIILIPEFPLTTEALVKKLHGRRREKTTSIIVAAEAGQPGRSIPLAADIKKLSGIEYKACILGHTQRGGTPTAQDRVMGSLMGAFAINALMDGANCKMVAEQHGELKLANFSDPQHGTRYFSNQQLLYINEKICDLD